MARRGEPGQNPTLRGRRLAMELQRRREATGMSREEGRAAAGVVDVDPLNILLGPDRMWIIDWAWPTRGAAFIDAACFLIRAMAPVTARARPKR